MWEVALKWVAVPIGVFVTGVSLLSDRRYASVVGGTISRKPKGAETLEHEGVSSDVGDDGGVDPYAKHLWPRPARPVLRVLKPGRIRLRWQTCRAVRLEYHGPPVTAGRATDMRSIELWHRDQPGWSIGKVRFLICHECRRGFIGNIDVQKDMWGRGIATRALADLRRQVPGYMWRTSLHLPGAKSFWLLIAERTGEDYIDTDSTCTHMDPFWTDGPTWAETDDQLPGWTW